MGALTLKSFPFELRGWDVEKFESIDPTDGFGSNTRVYISKQQIVQIEPDYNDTTSNAWLSDKGRQFFDGLFHYQENKSSVDTESWSNILKSLFKILYFFDHCNNKSQKKHFFTIVFENINIETLNLLLLIKQNYSFVKLKRAETLKTNNDLESNYQLNSITYRGKLNFTTLCLLIASNTRHEGYHLNLNLRQRFLKGNFKCLVVGSLIDLTFPSDFIGTNLKIIKNLVEGNNLICQDLKSAKNLMLIFNSELFSRFDGKNILEMIKTLKYFNMSNSKIWNTLNFLNSSLYETGIQYTAHIEPLTTKDLSSFSSLYYINISANNISILKKITKTMLLNYNFSSKSNSLKLNKLIINQSNLLENSLIDYNNSSLSTKLSKYVTLSTKTFYETDNTFINTEGLIKKTSKLFSKKSTKNNWKLLRNFLKQFKKHLTFLSKKENHLISFNSKKKLNFKNFSIFQFYATKKIDNTAFSLMTKTQPFFIIENIFLFKSRNFKINSTKSKYWLNDFFIGGKDGFSQNSLVMTNCSKIIRTQTTNFC